MFSFVLPLLLPTTVLCSLLPHSRSVSAAYVPQWYFAIVYCVSLHLSVRGPDHHHHHHHQSLNREGRWGTTDDFATSFLHFSLFSTALWDLPNSRPVQLVERRPRHYRKVARCWTPGRSGGRIFVSRVNFLSEPLIRCPFYLRATTLARKRPRSFCQKCRCQIHLNTHTPLTQRSRSKLTMLSRHG